MQNWFRSMALLVCATMLTAGLVAPARTVQAATCTIATTADGRPYVAPTASGPGTGKTVGFDNTHGETAGMADWVLDGGFSDMACALAGQGYTVEEIRAYPLTLTTLNTYNVVVFGEPNIPFTTAEETALQSYVSGGRGLLLVGDHYQADRNLNTWDATEVFNGFRRGHYNQTFTSPAYNYNGLTTTSTYTFNGGNDWLASAFGFRFRFNAMDLTDSVNYPFQAGNPADPNDPGILSASKTFNITSGVTTVATYAGSTLSIVDPTKAMGIIYPNKNTLKRWASAEATDPVALYTDNVGTIGGGSATYGGLHEGAYVVVAKPSAGKVAAAGDSSLWEDATPKYKREDSGATKSTHDGWNDRNHATLGINLVNWLATSDATVGIDASLQQPATQEPYNVFTIGEPIVEPWSTPAAGYLWYDASTFKAGAYNGTTGGGGGGTATWAFNPYPPKAYPGNKYAAYLDGQSLTANGSYSTQAYLYKTSGGTQVSTRYNRTTKAYDDALTAVSLTANASGKLQRWEFWNLTAATADTPLSLRLKVGGTTMLTQSVTQVATGSFGYLTVESSLGYSDGLHAAVFTKSGALDTAVQILPTGNTTVTLPAGTYSLEIRNDTTVKQTGVTVTITAGATASLAAIIGGGGGTGKLVINEVYYDTPGDDNVEEWVELYNGTAAAINLSGYKLIDNATTYTLGSVSIPAGGYLVVAKNTTGFYNMHGFNPDVSGLTLAFGNTGDKLTLQNASSTELDFVAWESYVTGWSLNAATGQTIYRKDKLVDTNVAADWAVGTPTPKR
ncbi:MAG TPA: lamin tail domain-containing protein [Symbiobacteriaceae bacterium]|nr:lamin tail domain-containing protein [Symbiobacteriaceae bacterium]